MSKERMEEISQALMDNQSEIQVLLAMSPEDASARLKTLGYNFTAEELIAYGDELQKMKDKVMSKDGELNEENLEEVAGGGLVTVALFGVVVGYYIYTRGKW